MQEAQQACPPLIYQNQLFGSPLFVYETLSPLNAPAPNELTRIFVWLGQDQQTVPLATQANRWLINLFNCHHKIRFVYYQAEQSNRLARQIYKTLGEQSQQLSYLNTEQKTRLRQLEHLLSKMPQATLDYAKHLRDLEDYRTTIETNAKNYSHWLSEIRPLTLTMDNLSFLGNFPTANHPSLSTANQYLFKLSQIGASTVWTND
ncbi:conserved hypothetical protein [Beggiatoa sp. PS]|nr:conserved hypothetical protein [Beggiatoa sp. PS]